jgi:hypothetical protein
MLYQANMQLTNGGSKMSKIKAGDMVRVKERPDWPLPPGYKLANSEGEVASVNDEQGFVAIHLVKTKSNLMKEQPKDFCLTLRLENVEKV